MAVAHALREHWLDRAFQSAGIDRSRWRPAIGLAGNRSIVAAVYGYYARLYADHPDLLWAGMASLVGPAFYAGFEDVGALPDVARRFVSERVLRRGDDPAAELSWYETTFLLMQQKIFEDQALMHEAYLGRGLAGVQELHAAGMINETMLHAWEQIARGDPSSVEAGNRLLLLREQYQIIDRYYQQMHERRAPEGSVMTYLMTITGEPSLRGARAYPVVFPLTLRLRLGVRRYVLVLRTPAAAGNIAVFADRWRLITADTLPAYRRLLATDPEGARAMMETPVDRRAVRYRLLRRAGSLAFRSAAGWRVALSAPDGDADRDPRVGGGEEVTIDLRTAPAREEALRQARALRPAHPGRSFDVTVLLPEQHAYRAAAALVVTDADTASGAGWLAVKHRPQAGSEAAATILRSLAGEWGFDPAEVENWRRHADAAAQTPRHLYSTRVFRGRDADAVTVEFQVEHHVAEHEVVLDAFFSWTAPTAVV